MPTSRQLSFQSSAGLPVFPFNVQYEDSAEHDQLATTLSFSSADTSALVLEICQNVVTCCAVVIKALRSETSTVGSVSRRVLERHV